MLEAFVPAKRLTNCMCWTVRVRTIVREAHDTILNFVGKERLDPVSKTRRNVGA